MLLSRLAVGSWAFTKQMNQTQSAGKVKAAESDAHSSICKKKKKKKKSSWLTGTLTIIVAASHSFFFKLRM
jgi:hypothetical protein